ncbi:IclR family transcriptional regulator [Moorellaceae bacterium AZ2]
MERAREKPRGGGKRKANSGLVRSVERTLSLLEELARDRGSPKGVTELSRRLKLGKSTVYRLLSTLRARGYVEQLAENDRYRLGLKLMELGTIASMGLELRERAKPYLKKIVEETGQVAHLAILADGEIVYIDKYEGNASIKMNSYIGQRGYIHSTALGKAICAYLPEEMVEKFIALKGMPRLTPNTIVSLDEFKACLAKVRDQGYAVDNMENEESIRCIATPIFDYSGKVIAAISLTGTVIHIPADMVESLARKVVETGKAISRSMGYEHGISNFGL